METCPVCNTPIEGDAEQCPACGYRSQEATEAFKAVSLEPKEPEVAPAPSNDAVLTVLYGKQEGIVYVLDGEVAHIGRSPKCEVFLNDMTVSREHAVLERVGDGWSIRDADSFNGVWINNASIDHAMLNDRDVIQIGCFVLRYTN